MLACDQFGFNFSSDQNGAQLAGHSWVNFNIKDNLRQSSAVAFLGNLDAEAKVHVLTEAPVVKLHLAGSTCTGITYLHSGTARRVNARKETLPRKGRIGAADWRSFIETSAETVFHPSSTCKMGTKNDSVVTPDLRIHGIEKLRVADASVFPTSLSTNTNAAAMMVGWSLAEFLS